MGVTIFIILRRPGLRWRLGRAGKAISLLAAFTVSFHLGPVLVPAGAITAFACHRHDQSDPNLLPLADNWPGA